MTRPIVLQAIVTKYIGPTNHRSARIRATCSATSLCVAYDHSLGLEENHAAACHALTSKLGWNGVYIQGGMPDKIGGYVFVCSPQE